MKKLRQFILTAVIIGSVLTTATAAESLSVLLQKGIFAEETEGNLDAAIQIYEKIVAEAAANRTLIAQAQYRLGMCQLKKGKKEEAGGGVSADCGAVRWGGGGRRQRAQSAGGIGATGRHLAGEEGLVWRRG